MTIRTFVASTIVACALSASSSGATPPAAPEGLLEVTGVVADYAATVVRPRIGNARGDRIDDFLAVVRVLTDPDVGISSAKFKPSDFALLHTLGLRQPIGPGNLLLRTLPRQKRAAAMALYNKYMPVGITGIFFGPSASDIVSYRFAFGCTHYARTFVAVVKALKLTSDPRSLRYAVACESEGYNRCLAEGAREFKLDGHQFALVKLENAWFAIDTNRRDSCTRLPADFSPDADLTRANVPVRFAAIPGKVFLLRKIGKHDDDGCGDTTLRRLMNIYASGDVRSARPRWGRYVPGAPDDRQ